MIRGKHSLITISYRTFVVVKDDTTTEFSIVKFTLDSPLKVSALFFINNPEPSDLTTVGRPSPNRFEWARINRPQITLWPGSGRFKSRFNDFITSSNYFIVEDGDLSNVFELLTDGVFYTALDNRWEVRVDGLQNTRFLTSLPSSNVVPIDHERVPSALQPRKISEKDLQITVFPTLYVGVSPQRSDVVKTFNVSELRGETPTLKINNDPNSHADVALFVKNHVLEELKDVVSVLGTGIRTHDYTNVSYSGINGGKKAFGVVPDVKFKGDNVDGDAAP